MAIWLTLLLSLPAYATGTGKFHMGQKVTFKDEFYKNCIGTIVGKIKPNILVIDVVCVTKKVTQKLDGMEMKPEDLND